jgi:trehalose utilization protein
VKGKDMTINVTVWNEFRHEKTDGEVRKVYPEGIHKAIAGFLKREDGFVTGTATLDDPEHGLTADVLDKTDVLIWWGHCAHGEVRDDIVEKIQKRVLCGMGLVVLHSGHHSKLFMRLMGTTCNLKWRESGERERIWTVEPGHPIAEGIGDYIELEHEEMYGEKFDIPEPDTLVFIGWFQGGEVFRSGCCYHRGYGKIFYFQPGHETHPTYHDPNIIRVIKNAVIWAKPVRTVSEVPSPHVAVPLEKIVKG